MSTHILQCTIYFPGITKGNGIYVKDGLIATCAHVICDENSEEQYCKTKPFITGVGVYGIAVFNKNLIFKDKDGKPYM